MKNDNIVELTASALPVKTWNWLHVNDTRIKLPENISAEDMIQIGELPKGVTLDVIEAGESANEVAVSLSDQAGQWKQISGAIGTEYAEWLGNQTKKQYIFTVDQNSQGAEETKTPLHIHFELKENAQAAVQLLFQVKEGASAEVVIDCASPKTGDGILAASILCNLEAAAELSIHQVQMLGKGYQYISDIGAEQDSDSKLNVVRANLGGKNSYLGLKTSLNGKAAELNSRLAYLSRGTQKLDVNDIVLHKGKKTLSDLNSEGVLLDQTEKNYKGTIDLQHGCAGAKGQELETVLLLSDDVINKTVPLILCGEEDVDGNHGASIGKIDEETLLYMESRGITEEQARLLVVNGRLNQIIALIPDEKLEEKAGTFMKEVFTNESRLS